MRVSGTSRWVRDKLAKIAAADRCAHDVDDAARSASTHGDRQGAEIEAGSVAGVACRADLVDADQHGVTVAVEGHRSDQLVLPDVSPFTQYS